MWFQTPAEGRATGEKKAVAPVLACRPDDRCAVESEALANEFKKLVPPKAPANFDAADELSMKFIQQALKGEVSESALATYVSAALEPGKRKSSYLFNLAAHLRDSMSVYAPFSRVLQKELTNTASSPVTRGFCAYALGIIGESQALPEIKKQFSSGKLEANAARLFADGIFRIETDGGFLVDYVRKNYKGAQTDKEQIPLISGILVSIYNGTSKKVHDLLSDLALDKAAPEAIKPFAYKYAGTTRDEKKYGEALQEGLRSKEFAAGYQAALALGQIQLQPSTRDKATERIISGLKDQEVGEGVKTVLVGFLAPSNIDKLDQPIAAAALMQVTQGIYGSAEMRFAAFKILQKLQPNSDVAQEALTEFGKMDPVSQLRSLGSLEELSKRPAFKEALVELKATMAKRAEENEVERGKLLENLKRLESRYPSK